jgi:hypothetical protein
MAARGHRGWLALAALPLFVATCGDAPVPGETTADPVLQHDVAQLLMMMDAGRAKACQQRKIVDTRSVDLRPEHHVERWVVERCGERVEYSVTYRPSSGGGTDFDIHPEK